jgi:hypothetical protein
MSKRVKYGSKRIITKFSDFPCQECGFKSWIGYLGFPQTFDPSAGCGTSDERYQIMKLECKECGFFILGKNGEPIPEMAFNSLPKCSHLESRTVWPNIIKGDEPNGLEWEVIRIFESMFPKDEKVEPSNEEFCDACDLEIQKAKCDLCGFHPEPLKDTWKACCECFKGPYYSLEEEALSLLNCLSVEKRLEIAKKIQKAT